MVRWPSRKRTRAFTLIDLLVVIATIGILIGLMLLAAQKVRDATSRVKGQKNMKQLGLVFHGHNATYSQFPHPTESGPQVALNVFAWMLCGLAVVLLARALLPRTQSMGLLLTMLLGIAGAIVGGLFYSFIRGPSSNAWPGWIVAVLGAMAVLWIFGALNPRRWWQ